WRSAGFGMWEKILIRSRILASSVTEADHNAISKEIENGFARSLPRSRWIHMVRWQARAVARGKAARTHSRPALRQRGIRGGARLRWGNLQARRAHAAPDRRRAYDGL